MGLVDHFFNGSYKTFERYTQPSWEETAEVYYSRVEALEPWCKNATPMVEIGVLTHEEFYGGNRWKLSESLMGIENMFDQLGYQFDIIDSKAIFENYQLLILPDGIPVSDDLHRKLQGYIRQGGKIIATFESGLLPDGEIGKGLPNTEHVMYIKGLEVKARIETEVLAYFIEPYFNRTFEHYCSHRQTPSSRELP